MLKLCKRKKFSILPHVIGLTLIGQSLKKQGQCTDNFLCLLNQEKIVDFGACSFLLGLQNSLRLVPCCNAPQNTALLQKDRKKNPKTSNKTHDFSAIPMSLPSDHFLLVSTPTKE